MKDQYVGDISDFEKYALLRALQSATALPLAVCWMLTPPDGTAEGSRTQYLQDSQRYRSLDPYVFDRLKQIVESDSRTVAAVEHEGVLERATYFAQRLEDSESAREAYFDRVWTALETPALVFFDPDIGLAGASVRRGGRRSAMYVFDDELEIAYKHGHSLVIFDHWKRVQRVPYLRGVFQRIRAATGAPSAFSVGGVSRVVFIVVPQERHRRLLEKAAQQFAAQWPGISFMQSTAVAESGV
jgi:hypothetical protein